MSRSGSPAPMSAGREVVVRRRPAPGAAAEPSGRGGREADGGGDFSGIAEIARASSDIKGRQDLGLGEGGRSGPGNYEQRKCGAKRWSKIWGRRISASPPSTYFCV